MAGLDIDHIKEERQQGFSIKVAVTTNDMSHGQSSAPGWAVNRRRHRDFSAGIAPLMKSNSGRNASLPASLVSAQLGQWQAYGA